MPRLLRSFDTATQPVRLNLYSTRESWKIREWNWWPQDSCDWEHRGNGRPGRDSRCPCVSGTSSHGKNGTDALSHRPDSQADFPTRETGLANRGPRRSLRVADIFLVSTPPLRLQQNTKARPREGVRLWCLWGSSQNGHFLYSLDLVW